MDDFVVDSGKSEGILNKLEKDVAPLLTRKICVGKKGAKDPETFDPKKLYRSLNLAALGAGMYDPIFLSLLALRGPSSNFPCVGQRIPLPQTR